MAIFAAIDVLIVLYTDLPLIYSCHINARRLSNHKEAGMVFWKRLVITVIAMLAASFILGYIWRSIFNMVMPSYLAGFISGLTALPIWEFLKRIKAKETK